MTSEASWVGTVPQPPEGSSSKDCTRSLVCVADQHYVDCKQAIKQVSENLAKKHCSNHGHEWTIIRVHGLDQPFAAACETCGKRLRMAEET